MHVSGVFLFVHEGVEQERAAVYGFGLGGGGWESFHGAGLRVGSHRDYFQGGAQAEGRGGCLVVQDFAQDGDGLFGQGGGLVVPEHGAFTGGEFEFTGEGGVGAAPSADGIAMDAGCGCCIRGGHALSEQAEDVVLRWRESGVWRLSLGFWHRGLPGFRISGGVGMGTEWIGVKLFGISGKFLVKWRERRAVIAAVELTHRRAAYPLTYLVDCYEFVA